MAQIECCSCGIVFSVSDYYDKRRREDHANFWCPNGHQQCYPTESEADRYKRLYHQENANSLSTREKLAAVTREKERIEKQFKQHKKRSAAGVCPCCNRTVAQLARHMQSKHKEFAELQGVSVKQLTEGQKPN